MPRTSLLDRPFDLKPTSSGSVPRRAERRKPVEHSRVVVIGAPSGAGACGVGQEQTPTAIRAAGLIDQLSRVGFQVDDLGDSPVVPWRPDRANPQAQNLHAVLETVQTTTKRVAEALVQRDRLALVLGGDCTVGIGTVAGIQQAIGPVALAYFDLHSDLNTPASASDGALDWMALGHMLAVEGAEPTLTAAAGNAPLLDPGQVVLVAHAMSHSTRFERGQIERLGLARVALEEVRGDPEGAASQALQLLANRSDHYAIHLDVTSSTSPTLRSLSILRARR